MIKTKRSSSFIVKEIRNREKLIKFWTKHERQWNYSSQI